MDNDKALLTEQLQKKWQPVLEHPDLAPITDSYKKNVTTILLENQEQALLSEQPANKMGVGGSPHFGQAGGVDGFDPVLISLVRRSMPNLLAYDVCGVQPMTGPTGLIFAMRAKYTTQGGTEAFFNEADTDFGGTNDAGVSESGAHTGTDPLRSVGEAGNPATNASYTTGTGMNTAEGEGKTPAEMAFSIERLAVEAKTRTLKAEYSVELAQDLKAVHGLDAEAELANILSTEILAEINREIVRTIYTQAKLGCSNSDLNIAANPQGTTVDGLTLADVTKGVYDCLRDSDGRWSAERFRGLNFQIERECNVIAKETRRGKGNIVICSSDVASALSMSGILNHDPAFANLQVDDTGNTFVGVLNGRTKVYVDPYATNDYICAGYRGESQYDAGLYYCPYVPLQMMRAVDAGTFQPKIGFKTRYGIVENPFSQGTTARTGTDMIGTARTNTYYRIFRVDNLHGIAYSNPTSS
jgi:hypothetical protein